MIRQVRCVNATCPRAGIVAVVADRLVARGVVARPVLHCADCGDQVVETPTPLALPALAPERPTPKRPRKRLPKELHAQAQSR